jgi:hypothetical protein
MLGPETWLTGTLGGNSVIREITLGITVSICVLSSSAEANFYSQDDVKAFNVLAQNAQTLANGIGPATINGQDSGDVEYCVLMLRSNLEFVQLDLVHLESILLIASTVTNSFDENVALQVLKLISQTAINRAYVARAVVKDRQQKCSGTPSTAAKAEEVMIFFEQAATEIKQLTSHSNKK